MKIAIVVAKGESGDDYGPWAFAKKPSASKLEKFLREQCEQEFTDDNDGPGEYGSYLHIQIHETEIIE